MPENPLFAVAPHEAVTMRLLDGYRSEVVVHATLTWRVRAREL